MRRRQFITLLGSAAAGWPLVARTQQPAMPIIGYMTADDSEPSTRVIEPFRQALREVGYIEGRNVVIEFRFSGPQYDLLPELAADLVRRRVAVIVAVGATPVQL